MKKLEIQDIFFLLLKLYLSQDCAPNIVYPAQIIDSTRSTPACE